MLDTDFFEYSKKSFLEVRNNTISQLDAMGIAYTTPQGAFVFFNAGMSGDGLLFFFGGGQKMNQGHLAG